MRGGLRGETYMTCPECHDRLQQWLDGRGPDAAFPSDPPALCTACTDWAAAAQRLACGLHRMTPPTPPPDLTDRFVAGVGGAPSPSPHPCSAVDRRRRGRRDADAGCLARLSGRFAASPGAGADGRRPRAQPPAPPPAEAHATLRESVAEAGSAVASFTSRTADATVAKTKILIPVGVDPTLGKLDLQPSLDPPTLALRQTGQGVSAGLEPVTDSARRAVGLFLRELPPMEAAPKGGF